MQRQTPSQTENARDSRIGRDIVSRKSVETKSFETKSVAITTSDPHGGMQNLEARKLMSGDTAGIMYAAGTLSLEPTHAGANELVVEMSSDARRIRGVVNGQAGEWVRTTKVKRISINGGDADDSVKIDSRLNSIS
ncbi:MAG: hypothetical protein AAGK78_03605, partial [Planctomycetota bacterium]